MSVGSSVEQSKGEPADSDPESEKAGEPVPADHAEDGTSNTNPAKKIANARHASPLRQRRRYGTGATPHRSA